MNEKLQFRALYREFLFRMVDVELLSAHAQGDANKLLGQFAALLVFLSIVFCVPTLAFTNRLQGQALVIARWSAEHFLISTTMLVVGIFAVLSWNSMFPDKREAMVLMPLPVRARTIFTARVASLATALAVTVAAINIFTGLLWPFVLSTRSDAIRIPTFERDAAVPPLDAQGLKPVLDRDLDEALRNGRLRPGSGAGLVIGISTKGSRQIHAYGDTTPDTLFQIGSVTKTFTALALARMAEEGTVRLDQPVRELLPEGLVERSRHNEIALIDLATHYSSLPRMPKDTAPRFFGEEDLYSFLKRRGLWRSPRPRMVYSNLGFGLLGHALALRAGRTYEDLVRELITEPLALSDTAIVMSPEQARRFATGHDIEERPTRPLTLGALAGAGALRSTVGDLLLYTEAHLHPERSPLRSAIESATQPRARAGPEGRIGLAWLYDLATRTWWHGGATPGFTADVSFNRERDFAVAVLSNTGPSTSVSADLVGLHIRSRLTGEPPVALREIVVPASGGVLHVMRTFAVYWIVMLAAGAFVFGLVLAVQGLASQLPRPWFLRVSPLLQTGFFCLFINVYFLEPKIAAGGTRLLADWSPSFWFTGMFQQLTGSPALGGLATRAWIGLGVVLAAATGTYVLSYVRTMRRIVESPDIAPVGAGGWRLAAFGRPEQTAMLQFTVRTLMRSRIHRLLVAFYLGVGLGLTVFFLRTPAAARFEEGTPLIATTILLLGFALMGVNVAFNLPVDLRANWTFQMTPLRADARLFAARRLAFVALVLAPYLLICAVVLLQQWSWTDVAAHTVVMALLARSMIEVFVQRRSGVPFTCSYLPGASNVHIVFWLCIVGVMTLVAQFADFERRALEDERLFAALVLPLACVLALLRWRTAVLARGSSLQFEAEAADETLGLNLNELARG